MDFDPTLDPVNCGNVPQCDIFMRVIHANPTRSATSHSGSGTAPGLFNQVVNTLTELCTDTGPVIYTFQVKPQTFFLTTGQWVKKPNLFNTTSITLVAGISYHDVIERPLFSATARQPNLYHSL
jgi:hypothetical protein